MATSEASPTVIVIDDDPGVRKALQNLLQSVGLKVEALASAQEFFGRKFPEGPCCLVVDVRLPGKSGLTSRRTWQRQRCGCR
jgi:FixJ family two-component response regulator